MSIQISNDTKITDKEKKEVKETKSLIGKKFIGIFKNTIKELMEDLMSSFEEYRAQLSIAHLYFSSKEDYEIVDFMLLYIDEIIIRNIEVHESNLPVFVDSITDTLKKIINDTLGNSSLLDKKDLDVELSKIKIELSTNKELQSSLVKYWGVCNNIVKKYIHNTPILKLKYTNI